jgi:hypothetical protein
LLFPTFQRKQFFLNGREIIFENFYQKISGNVSSFLFGCKYSYCLHNQFLVYYALGGVLSIMLILLLGIISIVKFIKSRNFTFLILFIVIVLRINSDELFCNFIFVFFLLCSHYPKFNKSRTKQM